jgi:hypothetical protein
LPLSLLQPQTEHQHDHFQEQPSHQGRSSSSFDNIKNRLLFIESFEILNKERN